MKAVTEYKVVARTNPIDGYLTYEVIVVYDSMTDVISKTSDWQVALCSIIKRKLLDAGFKVTTEIKDDKARVIWGDYRVEVPFDLDEFAPTVTYVVKKFKSITAKCTEYSFGNLS